jgi:hypothetical protein
MQISTRVGRFRADILACTGFLCLAIPSGRSQTSAPPPPAEQIGNAPEVLFTAQELRDHQQQLLKAIDRVRQDAERNLQRYAAAVDLVRRDTDLSLQRYAGALDVKLDLFQQAFAVARERELQALRSSNRFVLTIASLIVGLLLVEMLFLTWLGVRSVNRLRTRMSAWLSELSPSPEAAALPGANAAHPINGHLIQETTLRLQTAIERLELRLLCLEQTAARVPTASKSAVIGTPNVQSSRRSPAARAEKHPGVALALGDGESLILLPHDQRAARFRSCRNILQKLRKKLHLPRIAKTH